MLIPDTPSAQEYALRQRQIAIHALAVFWLSVTAAQHDILKRPDLAQQASRDAADNCQRIGELAHNQGATP